MTVSGVIFVILGIVVGLAVANSSGNVALELVKALAFSAVGFIAGIGSHRD